MWFVIYYVWFYCANIAIFLQMVKDYTKEYNKKHCLFSLHFSHYEYFSKNRARQTIVGRWPPCPVLQQPNKYHQAVLQQ